MRTVLTCACALAAAALSFMAQAEQAAPLSALARLPVREITVFKDGHAFVLHEGLLPVDPGGDVQLDCLPTPVLGTFWPYSVRNDAPLRAVIASPRRVLVERTVLNLRELLEANPGIRLDVAKTDNSGFTDLELVGVPGRSAEELEETSPIEGLRALPEKGEVLLLKGQDGFLSIPFSQIKHVTFKSEPKSKLAHEEYRNLLTLKIAWPGGRPEKTAQVGVAYLQKGFRWIPGYRIALDGKGGAAVRLQATLLNELTDLRDVNANLVVGVPSFAFKETPDPIGLQDVLVQLSRFFDSGSRTGAGLSNAIMGQSARMTEARGAPPGPAGPDLGPEVGDAGRAEDLFVYSVRGLTLKKGERMVMPVLEQTLKYRDVYRLDLPIAPPPEVRIGASSSQQAELAGLLLSPVVEHAIRVTNGSKQPLTTAPALILRENRILAQGMMTYTAAGGETDIRVTTATDVRVKKEEKETGRTPNAVKLDGNSYQRVDMAGTLTLTNFKDQAIDLEVTRTVAGHAGRATHNGVSRMLNWLEDSGAAEARPAWWAWLNWPGWWSRLNGIGQFRWTIRLEPRQTMELGYTWHYFAG